MEIFYRKLVGNLTIEYIRSELFLKELIIGEYNVFEDPILFDFIVKAIQYNYQITKKNYNSKQTFRCICRNIKSEENIYLFNNYKLDNNCADDLFQIINYLIIKDGREKLKYLYPNFLLFQKSVNNILVFDIILYIANFYFTL